MWYFYLTVLILSVGTVRAGLFLNLKDDVLAIWEERHAQKEATRATKEKRKFRKFLFEASNDTILLQNNVTDLPRARHDKEDSSGVGTTKVNHNKLDAAPSPIFRTEVDNQPAFSPNDSKLTQNKTIIFKTGRASKQYTKGTVSKVSATRLMVTLFPLLNISKKFATKAKLETLKDNNIMNVLKREKHPKAGFLKHRYEHSSDQNKSSVINKKRVTKEISKVTRLFKLGSNNITLTKNRSMVTSGDIFREHLKGFHESKTHHNMSSALKKSRPLENSTNIIRHDVTKKHKSRNNVPEFRGHQSGSESSSSIDLDRITWMEEFNDHWMQKKFEALNSTQPRGDVVNMVAARPWGVPCGDPNQHKIPWGSCTLPGECDPEYRIYRGDYVCGRTSFVCCTLIMTNYDLYQGLDISMEGSSVSTDSVEKNANALAHRKHKMERMNRKRERHKRKRLIRNNIKRITIAFKKTMNDVYMNRSAVSRKKARELMKLIKNMKEVFKKDRNTLTKVHHYDVSKMDELLYTKLNQLKSVNMAFMTNESFRKIVMNENVDKDKLKQFLRSQPMFVKYFRHKRRSGIKRKRKSSENVRHVKRTNKRKPRKRNLRRKKHQKRNSEKPNSQKRYPHERRSGINLNFELDEGKQQLENVKPQNFDYDIEYGVLYY